jgi:hypothetical protein
MPEESDSSMSVEQRVLTYASHDASWPSRSRAERARNTTILARRQRNELSDDMAVKISMLFDADAREAVTKALGD